MKPVLLAEGSLTRRRALSALLSARGFAVTALASLDEAYTVLKRMSGSATTLTAVVLGWPEYADGVAEDVFGLVHGDQYEHLPVLILADSNSPGAVNWRMTRPRTALLQWADYHEAPDALDQLVRPATTAAPGPAASDGTLRVMLVDDSATVRLAFGKLLEKNGYQVETASSVAEGREKAKKAYFDIAIIDYFMPEANGPVLIAALKNDPNTSHILSATITGTYSDAVITESLAAGAVECLFKSEAKDLFLARLASLARTINDRKAIDSERRRLQGILGSVGDGVYGVDAEGAIAFINPAAVDILGYASGEDLIGCNAFDTFHYAFEDGTAMPRSASFLVQCYANGSQVPAWQTVFWTASKRAVPVECTVYPMKIDGERTGSVVAFRDISARRMLEEELRWQAEHDSLTKLHNRAWFEAQLEQEVARLKRTEQASLLLFIDVDRFKYINDTAGHSAGDQLLLEVSMRLKSRLRASDHLARMGGDEYAVILRNVNVDDVSLLADGFRKALTQSTFSYGGKSYRITVSIGVARLDQHTASVTEAMAHADIACHIAKNGGRNQTHLYTPETGARAAMDLDLGWSARLEEALKTDKFVLLFQPIVPLKGLTKADIPGLAGTAGGAVGAAVGRDPKDSPTAMEATRHEGKVEAASAATADGSDVKSSMSAMEAALQGTSAEITPASAPRLSKSDAEELTQKLRARNPDLGAGYEVLLRLKDHHNELISPSAFMPTAERFGLMADIDRWVIDRAFRALREVSRGEKIVFAINLSAQSLADVKLGAFVTDKLVQYNVDPTSVVFEVTESRAIDDLPRMQRLIHELRSLGCRIAVDDFGTGFSTFAYLRQLEADYLKIDGSLIHGLPDDPLDRAVVSALTSIAKAAGKKTVAECVEDPRALLALLECGVDFAQGHALGEPRRLLGAATTPQQPHAATGPGAHAHTDNVVALANRR